MLVDANTQTFLHHAQTLVKEKRTDLFATWYDRKGKPTEDYTFGRLWDEGGVIAYHLRERWGLQKGDRVILCYDFGLHFFSALIGCMRAGIVAVLVYPPTPPLIKSLPKLASVVKICSPVLILTDARVNALKKLDELNPTSKSRPLWPTSVPFRVTDTLLFPTASGGWLRRRSDTILQCFDEPDIQPDDTAFLQFTSGSTSTPKGVVVTHRSLVSNARSFLRAFNKYGPGQFVACTWLPQYHDMGLLCATIYPFCGGWRQHAMSPISFIQNPLLWVRIMSSVQANWGMVPDFSYGLVARKFLQRKQELSGRDPIDNLDLSSIWKLLSAAEPINVHTKQLFEETFAEYGLPKSWFGSGYGIAESVVAVSHGFDFRLSKKRQGDTSQFVAVGFKQTFDPDMTIKVVDPQTHREVEDNTTGEVWLAGPSITAGYYGQPELTKQDFEVQLQSDNAQLAPPERYLRTGDLGFFQNDGLFICGRIKDLLILNGVNHYPHDIEFVVQDASPAVRPGCVAAFSTNESNGDGDLQIVFEIRKSHESIAAEVCETVREAVIQKIGLVPSMVVAIKERTICKTTSGKIQRRANCTKLQDGGHAIIHCAGNQTASQSCAVQHKTSIPDQSQNEPRTDQELFRAALADVLGPNVSMESSWEANGLSSILTVELSNKVSCELGVTIPSDFQQIHPTPNALESYVLKTKAGFFPVHLPDFQEPSHWDRTLPWTLCSICQLLGAIVLIMLIASSTIPAYYFVTTVGNDMPYLLPLMIPVWYLTFTSFVILSKWIVIGKYSSKEIAVPSVSYLQWWFVDRLVHTWEIWVGTFIKNTPMINIIYKLMGTNIHLSVSIDAFLREFDLVSIGKECSVSSSIRCRKFGPWHDMAGPSLRFRPISVESNCKISGHLEPGVFIGDGSCVEKLSSVAEGSQVPDRAMAVGNPAHSGQVASIQTTTPSWVEIGCCKIALLFLQLYLSSGLFYIANITIPTKLLGQWRYGWLVRLILVVILQVVLSMVTTIIVKWCLVGKRRAGPVQSSWIQGLLDWFADYNYSISIMLFESLGANTWAVNFFLMALGMDIDLDSKVWAFMFPPSIVDLISVKSSFVSFTTFRTQVQGKYQSISIQDSSIGHSVFVEGGAMIQSETIQPRSFIPTEYQSPSNPQATREVSKQTTWALLGKTWVEVFVIFHVCLLFLSLLPTIEMWQVLDSASTISSFSFMLRLASALVVQTCAIHFVMVLAQTIFFSKEPKILQLGDWRVGFVSVFWSFIYICEAWTFLHVFCGTSFYGFFLKCLGATVEGRLLYFGDHVYDFPLVAFADGTIVDSAFVVCGHSGLRGRILMGKTHVSGVLHPGTIALANTQLLKDRSQETGPMTFVSPTIGSDAGTGKAHEKIETSNSSDEPYCVPDDDEFDIENQCASTEYDVTVCG